VILELLSYIGQPSDIDVIDCDNRSGPSSWFLRPRPSPTTLHHFRYHILVTFSLLIFFCN
jgi:hypothetical protein